VDSNRRRKNVRSIESAAIAGVVYAVPAVIGMLIYFIARPDEFVD
jgi:hypothetical protein